MTTGPISKMKPIDSAGEAEQLLTHIGETMVALVQVFEDETRLIRAGKLTAAAQLTPEKTSLAARYVRDIEYVKANSRFICESIPNLVEEMRMAHASFREILSRNLRVIATAQSVAEGIVRGAAEEANRSANPRGYHSNGRAAPLKAGNRPVVVSRSS